MSRRNAGCEQLADVQDDRHPAERAHPQTGVLGRGEQPHRLLKHVGVNEAAVVGHADSLNSSVTGKTTWRSAGGSPSSTPMSASPAARPMS